MRSGFWSPVPFLLIYSSKGAGGLDLNRLLSFSPYAASQCSEDPNPSGRRTGPRQTGLKRGCDSLGLGLDRVFKYSMNLGSSTTTGFGAT